MAMQKGNGNPTPWQTDRWFVSPWNYLDETTKGFAFPKRIQFHDVCLRDGEQQAGVEFTPKEKIKLATMLAEAGVHRIEAGMPAVSKYDAQAVRDIVKLKLPAEIFAFSRCMVEDVKRAVDTGVKGIVMEVPASEHIIKYAYQWSLEKAVDLSIEATRYAKSQGLYVVFFPIDASRAEIVFLEGDASSAIVEASRGVDLIVMGTHGRRGPSRWWLGSVAERVVQGAAQGHIGTEDSDGTRARCVSGSCGLHHRYALCPGSRFGFPGLHQQGVRRSGDRQRAHSPSHPSRGAHRRLDDDDQ